MKKRVLILTMSVFLAVAAVSSTVSKVLNIGTPTIEVAYPDVDEPTTNALPGTGTVVEEA